MRTIAHSPDLSPAMAKTRRIFEDASTAAMKVLGRIGRGVVAGHKAAQRARLASVLARLPDDQLAQIGIKRSEIWSHVEKITAYEYDGL
jgi:uncharacterized protein YjiS (DUF1127 family)